MQQKSQLNSDPQCEFETHIFYRQKASEHIVRNAQRMSIYYNKKCKTPQFSINQFVTVQIPKYEHSATDFTRLPCKIIQQSVKENMNLKLATKHSILKGVYRAGDLMPFSSKNNPNLSKVVTNTSTFNIRSLECTIVCLYGARGSPAEQFPRKFS